MTIFGQKLLSETNSTFFVNNIPFGIQKVSFLVYFSTIFVTYSFSRLLLLFLFLTYHISLFIEFTIAKNFIFIKSCKFEQLWELTICVNLLLVKYFVSIFVNNMTESIHEIPTHVDLSTLFVPIFSTTGIFLLYSFTSCFISQKVTTNVK